MKRVNLETAARYKDPWLEILRKSGADGSIGDVMDGVGDETLWALRLGRMNATGDVHISGSDGVRQCVEAGVDFDVLAEMFGDDMFYLGYTTKRFVSSYDVDLLKHFMSRQSAVQRL